MFKFIMFVSFITLSAQFAMAADCTTIAERIDEAQSTNVAQMNQDQKDISLAVSNDNIIYGFLSNPYGTCTTYSVSVGNTGSWLSASEAAQNDLDALTGTLAANTSSWPSLMAELNQCLATR